MAAAFEPPPYRPRKTARLAVARYRWRELQLRRTDRRHYLVQLVAHNGRDVRRTLDSGTVRHLDAHLAAHRERSPRASLLVEERHGDEPPPARGGQAPP